jgi:hypothetical protein
MKDIMLPFRSVVNEQTLLYWSECRTLKNAEGRTGVA